MELGKATLRNHGVNILQSAIHPRHGLVWTDGKVVYLAPIRLFGESVENASSHKLGEFDNVKSLHWSVDIDSQTCYFCVVHQHNVTVWRVSGNAPSLNFKQVRKISVPPIPQGCLWNPSRDILCLLSRHQCSFYFRHGQNKGSYAFPPLESGKVTCGMWSEDGQQLVVCVGAVFLIYTWGDIDTSIGDFTPAAWRVPGLDGSVTSLISVSHDTLVCAADLPLESLCKQQDSFIVPDVVTSNKEMSADREIIHPVPATQSSVKDSLLNLPRNPQTDLEDTCQLIVVRLRKKLQDPVKLSRTNVSGILSPDLIAYERKTESIIVGSNSQSLLHVFTFIDHSLHRVTEMQLEKDQRPKGTCQVPKIFADSTAGVLVMVGQRYSTDSTFLNSSSESQYDLQLKFFAIKIDKSHLRNSYSTMPSSAQPDVQQTKDKKIKSLSGSHLPSQRSPHLSSKSSNEEVHISLSASSQTSTKEGKKMIVDLTSSSDGHKDLETETVQFSSRVPQFKNWDLDKFYDSNKILNLQERNLQRSQQTVDLVDSSVQNLNSVGCDHLSLTSQKCASVVDPGQLNDVTDDDNSCEVLEKQIRSQKKQIDALQRRLEELSKVVEDTSCVFPIKYQSLDKPEKVKIVCCHTDGRQEQRMFLLDNKRLQLDPIKQAFGLATVELLIDGEPCVLGENIDGYIPMRFEPTTTLTILGHPTVNLSESQSSKNRENILGKDPVTGATRC